MSAWPALILAGGRGQRLGRDKATVVVDGRAMVVHVAHALRKAGAGPLVVQVHTVEQRTRIAGALAHLSDVSFLLDDAPNRGSRDALATGLAHAVEQGWAELQLAPCDMPRLDAGLFTALGPALARRLVIPRAEGRLQPLLARVRPGPLLQRLTTLSPKMPLRDVMRSVPHTVLDADALDLDRDCFLNINGPADLARTRR